MSFAVQKLDEVATLTRALTRAATRSRRSSKRTAKALEDRRNSPRTRNPQVRERACDRSRTPTPAARARSPTRREAQHERLGLPLFPTTTIGSFPQTAEIRTARARLRKGEIDDGRVPWS